MQTTSLHFSHVSSSQCGWASVGFACAVGASTVLRGCLSLFWQRAFVPRCFCLRSSLVGMGTVTSSGELSGSLDRHRSCVGLGRCPTGSGYGKRPP